MKLGIKGNLKNCLLNYADLSDGSQDETSSIFNWSIAIVFKVT